MPGLDRIIRLEVGDSMRLRVQPPNAGHEGDHHANTFVVSQPRRLDRYLCTCEIETSAGKQTYAVLAQPAADAGDEHCRHQPNSIDLLRQRRHPRRGEELDRAILHRPVA